MADTTNTHVTAMSVKMIADITLDDNGDIHGELDCMYFAEPFAFTSLVRMIEMMEITFDTKGFPESHLLPRTFGKAKRRFRKHELDLHAHMEGKSSTHEQPKQGGTTCTFEISVRYRHNAEWQGTIHWVEKDTTKDFSSIVELVKLMDNALTGE